MLQPERAVLEGAQLIEAERQFKAQLDEQRRKQDSAIDLIELPPSAPSNLVQMMTRVSVVDEGQTLDMRCDTSMVMMEMLPPRGPSMAGVPARSEDDSRVVYPPRGPSMAGERY